MTLFQELEMQLLAPHTRRNADVLEKLLAKGFFEFGASGPIYTRQLGVDTLPAERPYEYRISDLEARNLGNDATLVTDRSLLTAHGAATLKHMPSECPFARL